MALAKQHRWEAGDPAPYFTVRSTSNERYRFDNVAGRYIVLMFFGSAAAAANMQALRHVTARREFFNEDRAAFFGVSIDPSDETNGRVRQSIPGIRFFWDFDQKVSQLYGAAPAGANEKKMYNPFTLILDPMLRVLKCISLRDVEEHNRAFDAFVATLTDVNAYAGVPTHAPVLVLPRVFELEFCRELMAMYDADGGMESGFMREIDGKTVGMFDDKLKRRRDFYIDQDTPVHQHYREAIQRRFMARLVPEVKKAFQFAITHMERYVVARYDSEVQGFFHPHRDDTTAGTVHRKFACSINLNAEEYEGGDLRFPEFGSKTYRAPTGGAVIFSCSLQHEALPVTRGVRYAYLPFFYDAAAAELRAKNAHMVVQQTVNKNKGEDETSILGDPSTGA